MSFSGNLSTNIDTDILGYAKSIMDLNNTKTSNKQVNNEEEYKIIKSTAQHESNNQSESYENRIKFFKIIPSKVRLVFDMQSNSVIAEFRSLDGELVQRVPSDYSIMKLHIFKKEKGLLFEING